MNNKNSHFMVKNLLIILCSVQILLSYLFRKGKGLLVVSYFKDGEVTYVTELLSSGSDDNVCIEVGIVLFSLLFIWLVIRKNKRINYFDLAIFAFIALMQAIFVSVIEAGSIADTIMVGGDIVLLLWCLNNVFLLFIFAHCCLMVLNKL